ncbi:MAG: phosphoenolpyruvate--protein phosphotransferase [Candidatus Hydrogenedentes bacterium]|nr:phosphoenolpyruvate--protein phosphotransferase [Candidatus Hydrogenedentota bacterium]
MKELGESHGGIFHAHLLLLDDLSLRNDLVAAVVDKRLNAEHVVHSLAEQYARTMRSVTDPMFRERAADLLDVTDRILHHLLDAERPNLKQLQHPCIIVAHDLSPSDAATLDVDHTLGLVVDSGSVTSHTAILARALEIPAVMGLSLMTTHIENGVDIALDGSVGIVVLHPTKGTRDKFLQGKHLFEEQREALRKAVEAGPCRTRDGVEVPTLANIELPIEVPHSLKANAEGIGLYRTEYLFLNRDSLPTEEEQYQAYLEVARALKPKPVTLRTMDLGGDKFASHVHFARDENPQLGWRAVRFCLARPDIFKVQLRAMLRASTEGNVEIMFPMISGLEELLQVKAVLEEVKEELKREKVAFDPNIRVGSMIEVPSAVALTDALSQECDFFSIGTNDLIQYSLAVDRVNEKIAHLYEPAHPAVLRMIKWTANAARAAGIPCGLCGEMAGDPLYTEVLLGLGVTSLSMSAVGLPAIRAEISRVSLEEARALAREVLKMHTAREIKARLREKFESDGRLAGYATPLHGAKT